MATRKKKGTQLKQGELFILFAVLYLAIGKDRFYSIQLLILCFNCYVIEKHGRSLITILDNSHLHRDIGNLQNKYAPKRVQMKDHICSHINPYENALRKKRIWRKKTDK